MNEMAAESQAQTPARRAIPPRFARRAAAGARSGAAAALPVLPRAARRRRRPVRRPAGRSCPSSSRLIARGSASPSSTIPAPACCRWRRSPIRRPMTAPAPRCATTTSPARWCISYKYSDRLDLAPLMGRWMARAGAELTRRRRRADPGAAALAAAVGTALQPVGGAGRRDRGRRAACRSCIRRLSACAPPPSRSACRRPSGRTTCRAPSACRRRKRPRSPGRRLVLIDDVLTSGATVDTCARALLRAGAAHVDVLVFARVVSPARTPI